MSKTNKPMSDKDANQVLTSSYNDIDATVSVSGFVNAQLGNSVQRTVISAVIDEYSFYDNGTLLYTIRIVYNNSNHDEIDSATRTV